MPTTSLYIHIPFCIHRCGYCDFNTYAGQQALIPVYSQALCRELEYISVAFIEPLQVHTVYFGGGTPSLVPAEQIEQILKTIGQRFSLSSTAEVTMEANPGTVSMEYLKQVRKAGINRLSIGMQSAHQAELTLLERQHTYGDVINAMVWARQAGMTNVNLDLIFGLPDQGINTWLASLESALSLHPEHLSLYALSLEHGTPLKHKVDAGLLSEPDADRAADMYEAARERIATAGFIHYEISNWARRSTTAEELYCQHNLQYWRTLPYLGVGAGAHGFVNHYRTVNVATPKTYITRMDYQPGKPDKENSFPRTPATLQANLISTDTEIGEFMMMGLRLVTEGVSNAEFQARYRLRLQDKFEAQITRLISLGLLEWNGLEEERLRLTQKGHLLGNLVFREFI